MKYLLSFIVFGVSLASYSLGMTADCSTGIKQHSETLCTEDPACGWDAKKFKCSNKVPSDPCSKHSEFYCKPNGCHWDSQSRKCTTGTSGAGPT
jgi:hypothetical protein